MRIRFVGDPTVRDILGIRACGSSRCRLDNLRLFGRDEPIDTMPDDRTGHCFFCDAFICDPAELALPAHILEAA